MLRVVGETPEIAKSDPDKLVGKGRQTCRSIAAVMKALEKKFLHKAAYEIAGLVGAGTASDVRNAERWLVGTELRARELAKLIQSDVGDIVLNALMSQVEPKKRPAWWKRHARVSEIVATRALLDESKARVEKLERDFGSRE